MKPNILMTGSNGFVGTNLRNDLINYFDFRFISKVDLVNNSYSISNNDDIVIHLAGLAHDVSEKKKLDESEELSFFKTPIRFENLEPPKLRLARQLGQDTDAVLKEFLNLQERDLTLLREEGVIL